MCVTEIQTVQNDYGASLIEGNKKQGTWRMGEGRTGKRHENMRIQ